MNRNRVLKVNVHNPNVRLFVGGVDKNRNKDQIMEALSQLTGMSVCMSPCLSVSLPDPSDRQCVSQSVCVSICLSLPDLSVYLCLSACMSLSLISLSVWLSVCVSL